MWKATVSRLLLLPAIILHTANTKLVGDHICQSDIIEPVEFAEWFLRNSSVRNYQWCWNVPPRCSTYTTKVLNETRIVVKNVSKTIEHCCKGFQNLNNECVSLCPNCINGICKNGECICNAGWKGDMCDARCLIGKFGSTCTNEDCNCMKLVSCNVNDPKYCDCITGWLPDSCKDPCPKPDFGRNCSLTCKCDLNTKECLPKSNQDCHVKFQEYVLNKDLVEINDKDNVTELNSLSNENREFSSPKTIEIIPNYSSSGVTETFGSSTVISKETSNSVELIPSSNISIETTTSRATSSTTYIHPVIQISADSYNIASNNISTLNENLLTTHSSLSTLQDIHITEVVTEATTSTRLKYHTEKSTKISESKIFRVKILGPNVKHEDKNDQRSSETSKTKTIDLENSKENVNTESLNERVFKATTDSLFPRVSIQKPELEQIETTTIKFQVENEKSFELDYESNLKNHLSHESLTTSLNIIKEDTELSNIDDKNYFVIENLDHKLLYYDHNRIIQYVSIAAIVTLIVVTTSVGLLVLRKLKKKKNGKKDNAMSTATSTVAVYTTSIFHTPLPDPPPTFENPRYLRAEEFQNKTNMKTFQAETFCNKSFVKPKIKEIREYTYDYPPSTGSYRATSTIDAVSEVDITQKLGQIEPLYDEIPSRDGQQPVSPIELQVMHSSNFTNNDDDGHKQATSLYMNTQTCQSTRF